MLKGVMEFKYIGVYDYVNFNLSKLLQSVIKKISKVISALGRQAKSFLSTRAWFSTFSASQMRHERWEGRLNDSWS